MSYPTRNLPRFLMSPTYSYRFMSVDQPILHRAEGAFEILRDVVVLLLYPEINRVVAATRFTLGIYNLCI